MNLLPFFVMPLSFFPIYSPSSTSFSSLLFPFLPPIPASPSFTSPPLYFLFLFPFYSFLFLPPSSSLFLPFSFLFFSLPSSLFLPFSFRLASFPLISTVNSLPFSFHLAFFLLQGDVLSLHSSSFLSIPHLFPSLSFPPHLYCTSLSYSSPHSLLLESS